MVLQTETDTIRTEAPKGHGVLPVVAGVVAVVMIAFVVYRHFRRRQGK
jgi:hypothetical protein